MIKIQKISEIEKSFFGERDFGDSIQSVRDILRDVKARGDEALHDYSKKFDVASPDSFLIAESTLKACAEKMQKENVNLYNSICYSRDLAVKFAKKQRESFDDFEMEIAEGVYTGQKNIAVETSGNLPAGT